MQFFQLSLHIQLNMLYRHFMIVNAKVQIYYLSAFFLWLSTKSVIRTILITNPFALRLQNHIYAYSLTIQHILFRSVFVS